jgi:hypothetical protein
MLARAGIRGRPLKAYLVITLMIGLALIDALALTAANQISN